MKHTPPDPKGKPRARPPVARRRPGPPPRARRWPWILLALPFVLVGLSGGLVAGAVTAAMPQLPRLEGSGEFRRFEGLVYARDGKTVLRRLRAPTSRRYAKEADLPDLLIDAVVATEDRRFFEHRGVDPRSIVRAALVDLKAGAMRQGGSTITQQLVKNAYVGSRRSVARKSREVAIALALETRWSKRRILAAYLNTAYFGQGEYGVRDASRHYFGVEPARLNLQQAAVLAGSLRSPEIENAAGQAVLVRNRRDQVLEAMGQTGVLDDARVERALLAEPARPRPNPGRRGTREIAPHFTDEVVGELVEEFGAGRALGGGLRVRTTLDPRMQRAATDAVQRIEGTGLSTALVCIDVRTGEVRAMAIGGPARRAVFNVATRGRRQPGSAFKPFTLAAAYSMGLTPTSRFRSAPFSDLVAGERYRVTNSSGTYAGLITLEQATWDSDNTVYARLAKQVGVQRTVDAAVAAGIVTPLEPLPSTVLGGLRDGVTPLELAHAYATFARRGVRRSGADGLPVSVRKVSDPGTGALDAGRRGNSPAFSAPVADLVTDSLRGVITRGTGTRGDIGRPAAGKTGTTEEYADAWFAGYTPQLVAAVWVGRPEGNVPMLSEYEGGPVTGGSFPAEIWGDFMRTAHEPLPVRQFASERLRFVTRRIDPRNRLLAEESCEGSVEERFLAGTEPTEESTTCPQRERALPDVTGLAAADARRLLEGAGFTVDEREVAAGSRVPGSVVAQVPAAGTPAVAGREVRLLVAARDEEEPPAADGASSDAQR